MATPQTHIYKYRIYQINPATNEDANDLLYRSYSSLTRNHQKVDPSIYEKVAEGEMTGEAGSVLDSLWLIYNDCRVTGFEGRSMSVSDIIVLERNQKETVFYVDTFGFQQIKGGIRMEA